MGATSRSCTKHGFSWAALTRKNSDKGIRPLHNSKSSKAEENKKEKDKADGKDERGEGREEEENESDDECNEEAEVRIANDPGNPTHEEIERYNVMGHI